MTSLFPRLCLSALLCLLGSQTSSRAAQIDLDGDGMGDVWEQFFNATGLLPGGDEDWDGTTNVEESLAGTDPFDGASALGFSDFSSSDGERSLTWDSLAGKRYQLRASGDLQTWVSHGDSAIGSDGAMTMKLGSGDAGGLLVGAVTREVWRDVRGKAVADLTSLAEYPASPTGVHSLTKLECPVNDADNFGARVKGYIIAPRTATFSFSLSSADAGQFWLSKDAGRDNLKLIASSGGDVVIHADDVIANADAEHQHHVAAVLAQPVSLVAGEIYYFELLHKGGVGDDHCRVSWKLPSQTSYSVIAGRYLAAWFGAGEPVGTKRRLPPGRGGL